MIKLFLKKMFSDFFTLKNEKIEISLLIALISFFPFYIVIRISFYKFICNLTSLIFYIIHIKKKIFILKIITLFC